MQPGTRLGQPGGAPDLTAGSTIGDYQIIGLLGRGGMGSVYEAVHPVIDKKVAIKLLHHEQCQNSESVARFVQEAKAVNRIGHPNIVDVFGFGTTEDGRAYLVMELLVGEPLAAWLSPSRAPGLSVASTCDILIEVTHALEAAHAAGIIHRDLKPDNIFLATARNGQTIVKLLDFGIAKLGVGDVTQAPVDYTQPGVFVGTPKYIAPEQARGQPLDGSADVYQLGVVAFELLAGRPPFVGNDSVELVAKHITMQAPLPSDFNPLLPRAADDMCRAMLDKDPSKRPNVGQVRAMLEQIRTAPAPDAATSAQVARAKATEIVDAPVVPPSAIAAIPTEHVPVRRGGVPWWAFMIGGLAIVAAGIYFFGYLLDRGDAPPQQQPAPVVQQAAPELPKPTVTPIPEAPPPAPPPVAPPDPPPVAAPPPPPPDPVEVDPPKPPTPKPPPVTHHHAPSPPPPPHVGPKDLPIAPPDPPKPPKQKPDDPDAIKSPFDKKKS